LHGRFVTALRVGGGLTVNSPTVGSWQVFNITNNSDGTVALLSCHGKWVGVHRNGQLVADGEEVRSEQSFWLSEDADGTVSLQSHSSGLFALVASEWHHGQKASRPMGPRGPSDEWHPLAEHCAWDTGIITFLGSAADTVVDSAVVLGLSLQRFARGYPRVGIVVSSVTQGQKMALANAGWQVLVVENSTLFTPQFNIFQVCMRHALYVDPTLVVFSREVPDLLKQDIPSPRHIAMTPDSCERGRRPGHVMLFRPSVFVFDSMVAAAQRAPSGKTLRELAMEEVYHSKVRELHDLKLGFLGKRGESCLPAHCGNLAAAQFSELTEIDTGPGRLDAVDCPELRRDYLCRMKQHAGFLSSQHRMAMAKITNCTLTLGL
jgi:hypothetical protein